MARKIQIMYIEILVRIKKRQSNSVITSKTINGQQFLLIEAEQP